MKLSQGQERLLVYLFFGAVAFWIGQSRVALDLSADYIACRQVALGQWSQIYLHHGPMFGAIMDPERWARLAGHKGFPAILPDYIQSPAVAWALQPVCRALDWRGFIAANAAVEAIALIAIVETCARRWAQGFLKPAWAAAILAASLFMFPARDAAEFGQISLMVTALCLLGLAGAHDRRPGLPAIGLAAAAAIKLTPAALVLHPLVARRWRWIAAFFAAFALFMALGTVVGGLPTFADWVAMIGRLSGGSFGGLRNQSLIAASIPTATGLAAIGPDARPLPLLLKVLSAALTLAAAALGGWVALRPGKQGEGVCISLVGVTLFSPLAWAHYYVALIPALVVILRRMTLWRMAAAGFVYAWAVLPISIFDASVDTPHYALRTLSIAGLAALAALTVAALEAEPDRRTAPASGLAPSA